MGVFQEQSHAILGHGPVSAFILAASSWQKATSDRLLADGPCGDLRGMGANVGCIGWPLTARLRHSDLTVESVKFPRERLSPMALYTETVVFSCFVLG